MGWQRQRQRQRRCRALKPFWRAAHCGRLLIVCRLPSRRFNLVRHLQFEFFGGGAPAMLPGAPPVMAGVGKHRLSRSSSAEPAELLAAIRRGLPTQLPPLDAHTVAKLKVGIVSVMLGSSTALQTAWAAAAVAGPADSRACRRHTCLCAIPRAIRRSIHSCGPLPHKPQEQALKKAADLQQQASQSAKQGLHGARLVRDPAAAAQQTWSLCDV